MLQKIQQISQLQREVIGEFSSYIEDKCCGELSLSDVGIDSLTVAFNHPDDGENLVRIDKIKSSGDELEVYGWIKRWVQDEYTELFDCLEHDTVLFIINEVLLSLQ